MSDAETPFEGIDAAVDSWWERALRGKPALDRIMYSASEAANHSRLWHALGLLRPPHGETLAPRRS